MSCGIEPVFAELLVKPACKCFSAAAAQLTYTSAAQLLLVSCACPPSSRVAADMLLHTANPTAHSWPRQVIDVV